MVRTLFKHMEKEEDLKSLKRAVLDLAEQKGISHREAIVELVVALSPITHGAFFVHPSDAPGDWEACCPGLGLVAQGQGPLEALELLVEACEICERSALDGSDQKG